MVEPRVVRVEGRIRLASFDDPMVHPWRKTHLHARFDWGRLGLDGRYVESGGWTKPATTKKQASNVLRPP